jgi:DNA-binding XRE family transcriptional regulator
MNELTQHQIVAFKPWPVKPWLELRFLGKLMTFREVMRNKTLEEVRSTLAINLRTIRLSKGIAQERLALDAGVDRTVVSKIERAVTNPSIEVLIKLANQLDVDLTDLFVN